MLAVVNLLIPAVTVAMVMQSRLDTQRSEWERARVALVTELAAQTSGNETGRAELVAARDALQIQQSQLDTERGEWQRERAEWIIKRGDLEIELEVMRAGLLSKEAEECATEQGGIALLLMEQRETNRRLVEMLARQRTREETIEEPHAESSIFTDCQD